MRLIELRQMALAMILIGTFLAGWAFNSAYALMSASDDSNLGMPFDFGKNMTVKAVPKDRISEEQIKVYRKGIVLSIENATWSRFTDTHSMDPVLSSGANGIEVKPQSEQDVMIGDVISYRSVYADGLIVHRVISQGYDGDGWFVIVKGDNLNSQDPGKIRFSQIHGVLVGIIY